MTTSGLTFGDPYEAGWHAALNSALPGLRAGKPTHVQMVVHLLRLLIAGDAEGFYGTFTPEARRQFERLEYLALILSLTRRYHALSPFHQKALRGAAVFHDIGCIPGERSWQHDRTGAQKTARILQRLRTPPDLAAQIVFLVRHHSLIGNIGVDWFPEDLSSIGDVDLECMRLLAICDASGRTDGNPAGPARIEALLAQTYGTVTPEDYYRERIRRAFTPLLFLNGDTVDDQVLPALAAKGYLSDRFRLNYSRRIRVCAFDFFRRLARRSAELTAEFLYQLNSVVEAAAPDETTRILVDTDIDFMALLDNERRGLYVDALAGRIATRDRIFRCSDNSGELAIIITLQP